MTDRGNPSDEMVASAHSLFQGELQAFIDNPRPTKADAERVGVAYDAWVDVFVPPAEAPSLKTEFRRRLAQRVPELAAAASKPVTPRPRRQTGPAHSHFFRAEDEKNVAADRLFTKRVAGS